MNKSWKRHLKKMQLYGHQPAILKTMKIRPTRHEGGTLLEDKFITCVLLWTPSHGRVGVGGPAGTYLHQLCTDTGCSLQDLLEAKDDRDEWREREGGICPSGMPWSWGIYIYIYIHTHTHKLRENNNSNISKLSKVVSLSRGWPEGPLFNSYYTEV